MRKLKHTPEEIRAMIAKRKAEVAQWQAIYDRALAQRPRDDWSVGWYGPKIATMKQAIARGEQYLTELESENNG